MSPRRKKTEEERMLENEMTEEEMFNISGGVGRLRAKCPVCDFECGRMTELNAHMRECHSERC